jgi:hypothetical protein
VRILGIALALLNLLLWFCVPAIRAFIDEMTHRWANADNPRIMTGVQELLVYFDPWLARVVFPIIFMFGLAAIPFLKKPAGLVYTVVISLLLIALEVIWLLLIAVGILLRGPNWNIFWPGEEWDEYRIVPLNIANLSDHFWYWMGRTVEGMPWELRELPGLMLIGGYLLSGVVLAYGLFRCDVRATPYWRWVILVLLLQLATLVPFKLVCYWMFNIKYWIFIPEFRWNV